MFSINGLFNNFASGLDTNAFAEFLGLKIIKDGIK